MTDRAGTNEPGGADEVEAAHDALHTDRDDDQPDSDPVGTANG